MVSTPAEQWRVLRTRDPWAVQALADVQLEVEVDTWGHHDLWAPAYVWQATLDDQVDTEHCLLVATSSRAAHSSPDDVVGVGLVHLPRTANTRLALVSLMVRPGSRRAGVGRALQCAVEREAACAGRTTLVGYVASSPEPPPGPGALRPAQGPGQVAVEAASTRFALAHGYALAQVTRASVLDLPDDRASLVASRDEALAVAGPDYRLHTWHDEVPAGSLGQVAVLLARMSLDAPHGALSYEPELWDAARAGRWVRSFADRGLCVSTTVAEHVPSGVLAGHTVLMYPVPEVPFAFQQDTLVLSEYRGHRLGTAVKAANLLAAGERRPGLRRVHTDNAQENAPMLAINVALGFAAAGVHACWQKQLV